MKSRKVSALLAAFALLCSSVFLSTPAAALDPGESFCLYSKPNFRGIKQCGDESLRLVDRGLFWNVSSIEVAEGFELTGYIFRHFLGPSQKFTGSNKNLGIWNNRVNSLRITPISMPVDEVCFYAKADFNGRNFCTTRSSPFIPFGLNNRITSISVPAGFEVKVYSRRFFRGRTETYTSDVSRLTSLNNQISSFRIEEIGSGVDTDGDGVPDSSDQCPDTPAGVSGH